MEHLFNLAAHSIYRFGIEGVGHKLDFEVLVLFSVASGTLNKTRSLDIAVLICLDPLGNGLEIKELARVQNIYENKTHI